MITTPDKHRAEPSFPLFLTDSVEATHIESDFPKSESGGRLTSVNGA